MKLACVVLALALGGAAIPARAPESPVTHAATGWLGFTDGTCSGTFIGPDVVLSASHCFEGGPLQKISGQPCQQVGKALEDGNDHAIIRVSCKSKQWAVLGGKMYQRQEVHMFGNPIGMTDLFRRGYVMGEEDGWMLLDLMVQRGDSGSAIFDKQGRIVGVVSTLFMLSPFAGCGAKQFAFSREQLESVGL